MNNTHSVSMTVHLDDVQASQVRKVGASAVAPLCGTVWSEAYDFNTNEPGCNDGRGKVCTMDFKFWALNDNEAKRTVSVMQSAMSPLVRDIDLGVVDRLEVSHA